MRKILKSPTTSHNVAESRGYWSISQPPPLDTIIAIDGIKYEIKTSTIPNSGYGLFAQDNISASQFLMFYTGIKLDHDSWKSMCVKSPRVNVYSMDEDPNVKNKENLFYFYKDVNMGNVAGYINSSIYCRHRENMQYELYPRIPP